MRYDRPLRIGEQLVVVQSLNSTGILRGQVEACVLFSLNLETRRMHIAGMTAHPDRAWVAQQARNTAMSFGEQEVKPAVLLRDNDGKYGPQFDVIFEAADVAVHPISPRSPNLNARAERWVQTVKRELLDRFVVFGDAHLRYLISEFLSHYHQARPHQALGNVPPCGPPSPPDGPPPDPDAVVCEERLGGLLKHYWRRAA